MEPVARTLKAKLVIAGSCLAFLVAATGLFLAMRSPLFLLRVVEVADQHEGAPVDAAAISALADAPVGRENLFTLDLRDIEARLKTHPWIRGVTLMKRFPQTLSIRVEFRKPKAMLQNATGALVYVDEDGSRFGQVNLSEAADLPVLSGLEGEGPDSKLPDTLRLLDSWGAAEVGRLATVSSISYDPERGYRMLVTYPLAKSGRGRAMVELGQEIDGDLEAQLGRLAEVFGHLSRNGASARQIWADAGKKIVVKIARGS